MEAPSQPGDANSQGEVPSQQPLEIVDKVSITPRPPANQGTTPIALQPAKLSSRSGHIGKKHSSNAKVAIPRQRGGVQSGYSRRVPLACESCRARKTKCSGDTPVCRQCKELRVTCKYPASWRERTKGQLDALSTKAQAYEKLLRDLGNVVDGRAAEQIRATLERFSTSGEGGSTASQSSSATPQDKDSLMDEVSSSSSIGSLDAIDRVEEDVNRNASSRATGHMGKNSEVTWMQRLRKETEHRVRKLPGPSEIEPEGEFALHSMNYHLDDLDVSVPGPVQVYWMPPRHVADKLFDDYLETVHPFYPIISRTLFRAQYRTFFDSAARPGDKWLAILNLIFAISAKHAHLTKAPWRGDDNDHLVYLTRARILSMNGDALFSHPDLQQVQVEGLVAFYLLASDQINRAWKITALAVRSAISLGLNMKNTSESTPGISKEARYRVWWCVYIFEHMLGIMTGRVSCITDGICTTPLPLPLEEDQLREPSVAKPLNDQDLRLKLVDSPLACSLVRQMPSNPPGGKEAKHTDKPRDASWLKGQPISKALVFLYYVDLAVVSQEIVNRVYSLDCAMVPWRHIENRIGELRSRIDLWYSNLPEALDFSRNGDQGTDVLRGKLFLAFHYYSARITLGRPCLCRRDARHTSPYQKSSFSHDMAMLTLTSARQMLDLIPDVPNAVQLYQICPWWCVLHYLMQAGTVLLLELSFGCIHMPDEETNMFKAAKKAIRWLFSMSECSLPARRAWELCDGNLRRIATGMDYDLSDLPTLNIEPKSQVFITGEAGGGVGTDVGTDVLGSQPAPMPVFYDTSANSSHQPFTTGQNPPPYAGMAALDPCSSNPNFPLPGTDAYFPYDPISGEFIRSFFPVTNDEEPWDQS
ncbi:fungal-specific transcription factor domain-containing protein [Aspergillus avenaceus]|uniref:Fungal-specific transcription factor domain-containing protein n=1 Tax=Aspergillus avenaceus TaxID=36643 RepID=A0A5N6TVY2_ASPAV|nr:fungal-specific transcription factor domain-containing protein [Aspergillus avenaceus]